MKEKRLYRSIRTEWRTWLEEEGSSNSHTSRLKLSKSSMPLPRKERRRLETHQASRPSKSSLMSTRIFRTSWKRSTRWTVLSHRGKTRVASKWCRSSLRKGGNCWNRLRLSIPRHTHWMHLRLDRAVESLSTLGWLIRLGGGLVHGSTRGEGTRIELQWMEGLSNLW